MLSIDTRFWASILSSVNQSKSQFLQDIFVLSLFGFKKKGYFVEVGATDGVNFSNSYLLEKEFDWQGIVVEPSVQFHEVLKKNRVCNIDYRLIHYPSGKTLQFTESINTGLSHAKLYESTNLDYLIGKSRTNYITTVSLDDLLEEYNAPNIIDYLSIDIEGSEYNCLANFSFSRIFKVITVEHNYREDRQLIYDLLNRKGYERVHSQISNVDDWYVHRDYYSEMFFKSLVVKLKNHAV
jgi:FkbM family methyltransferase